MNINEAETREKIRIFLNTASKRGSQNLLEKDFYLTIILNKLGSNEKLNEMLVFKGGTALVKAYLGYYRFSEDIDFTWKDQTVFKNKTQHEIRRICGRFIESIGKELEAFSKEIGFDFIFDKSDERYVQLGGSNKLVTFRVHYESVISPKPLFFKIQINFVEPLLYKPLKKQLNVFADKRKILGEQPILDDILACYEPTPFNTYDAREILAEKIRAMLTRRTVKAKDILDIFRICRDLNIGLDSVEKTSLKKIRFALPLYKKYRDNLMQNRGFDRAWLDDLSDITLEEIDIPALEAFSKSLFIFLDKIKTKVLI